MNLTEAAIDAAYEALAGGAHQYIDQGDVRRALEAAAPHMCLDRHSQRTEWPDIPRSRP